MTEFIITILAVAFIFIGNQIWVETAEEKKRVTSLLVAQAKMSIDALAEMNAAGILENRQLFSHVDNVLGMLYEVVERTCGKSYVKRAYKELNEFGDNIDIVRKIIISKPLTKDEKETYSIKD